MVRTPGFADSPAAAAGNAADRIARVFAAAEAITIVVILVAPFVGSWIARLGVGTTFVAGGVGLALVGITALAFGLGSQRFGDGRGA